MTDCKEILIQPVSVTSFDSKNPHYLSRSKSRAGGLHEASPTEPNLVILPAAPQSSKITHISEGPFGSTRVKRQESEAS